MKPDFSDDSPAVFSHADTWNAVIPGYAESNPVAWDLMCYQASEEGQLLFLEANPGLSRYDSQGRRDPFRSLIGPAGNTGADERPPGTPGFLVDEIDLSGVVRTKQSLVAMIAGPDNKGYLLRVGDKVFDGEVVRITQDSIVFRQEVNDPTRIERFREVVKELSPQSVKK